MGEGRRTTPAVIVEAGYQAWLWIDGRVASFPRDARRSLGHRLLDTALDALVCTTEATYLPRGAARISRLERANRALSVARILLRGARDRQYLARRQHEHAMRLIDGWGRQIGGWLRHERGRGDGGGGAGPGPRGPAR